MSGYNNFEDIELMKIYEREMKQYPLLTETETQDCFQRFHEGDMEAKERLIECNLRLVVYCARRYFNSSHHLKFMDLVQEGNIGLIRAVETYDVVKGKFSIFAVSTIDGYIKSALGPRNQEIHVAHGMYWKIKKYQKFFQNSPSELSDEFLCRELNVTPSQLEFIKEQAQVKIVSLNKKVDDEEYTELGDFISSDVTNFDEALDRMIDREIFLVAKEILKPLYYYVIYYRYLSSERLTRDKIAENVKVTSEAVRQIEAKALNQLKPYLSSSSLFQEVLKQISEREGTKFNFLSIEPIHPNYFVKYMYAKPYLTQIEQELLKMKFFGQYQLNQKYLEQILHVDFYEYKKLFQSLNYKLQSVFHDVEHFKSFKHYMLLTNGTKIFDVNVDEKISNINYSSLSESYGFSSFQDLQDKFGDVWNTLTSHELKLLKDYFSFYPRRGLTRSFIEREVNLVKYGCKKQDSYVPIQKLYRTYLKNKDLFSEQQQCYLECFVFYKKEPNDYFELYGSSFTFLKSQLLYRLELCTYQLEGIFRNSFSKKHYLEVRRKYKHKLNDRQLEMLDLYFGIKGKSYTISELAVYFELDYSKMNDLIQKALSHATALFVNRHNTIDINRKLYIPYIKNPVYEFTKETSLILKDYLIHQLSYDEISKKYHLSNTRVSNIVTDGLRKIDFYRFGISSVFEITDQEFENVIQNYKQSFSSLDKDILYYRFIKKWNNIQISDHFHIDAIKLKRLVKKFYDLYGSYQIRDVELTIKDVFDEIECHPSESVLSVDLKQLASLYYGVQNSFNLNGKQYSKSEIVDLMNLTPTRYDNCQQNISKLLKKKKIGLIKSDGLYIPRLELDHILDDPHLPISEKERNIICYLFELKGFPYKTINELESIFGDTVNSLRRRYYRAIVNIRKYQNKEIEGTINFEIDIVPLLCYFVTYERKFIVDSYQNGISYEKMAQKYQISFDSVYNLMERIKTRIYFLMNYPSTPKFDFDYYQSVVHQDDLPFYADKNLAIQIFNMYYGLDGQKPMLLEKIISTLNLEISTTVVFRMITNLMLSVCKYKEGIRKSHNFTYEDVLEYYRKNEMILPPFQKKIFASYFRKIKQRFNSVNDMIPCEIRYDLILDRYEDCFNMSQTSREEVIALLRKYKGKICQSVRNELMSIFEISEREFMNGKDKNHVYRILYKLEEQRQRLIGEQHVRKLDFQHYDFYFL